MNEKSIHHLRLKRYLELATRNNQNTSKKKKKSNHITQASITSTTFCEVIPHVYSLRNYDNLLEASVTTFSVVDKDQNTSVRSTEKKDSCQNNTYNLRSRPNNNESSFTKKTIKIHSVMIMK